MWMGGPIPLGYDNLDRTLKVNPEEAEAVHHIYQRYLDLDSVKLLKEELDREGIRSKRGKNGSGGRPFSRGALYALLQNPLYIGKIRHKENVYDGNHEAIIEKTQWQAVQAALTRNRHNKYLRTQAKEPSLLAGLVFDNDGHPFSPTHTRKKNRRYRYYVNQALVQFKQIPPDAATRVPAQTMR
jgi:site-specific DNA recombinase